MRVRTEFFIASFEELRDEPVPADGPAFAYPAILTQVVDIALLWELAHIVSDIDLETFLRDTHLVEGPETPGELDKPTIELLPGSLIDALIALADEDLDRIAERWSEVREWRGQRSTEYLLALLEALNALAVETVEQEKLLFLWTCFSTDEGEGLS